MTAVGTKRKLRGEGTTAVGAILSCFRKFRNQGLLIFIQQEAARVALIKGSAFFYREQWDKKQIEVMVDSFKFQTRLTTLRADSWCSLEGFAFRMNTTDEDEHFLLTFFQRE